MLLETEDGTLPTITELADAYDGEVRHVIPAENYHKKMGLSDFTWNHTTLWALKKDPSLTYLQAGFSLERYGEQIAAIKRNYPDEVLLHFEWMMNGGKLTPASLPVVRYKNKDRLYEIISFFESVGVRINDPHTFLLDYGSRGQYERMREQKRLNDPYGLLNPGKINDQTG